jgi:hypothetical protein
MAGRDIISAIAGDASRFLVLSAVPHSTALMSRRSLARRCLPTSATLAPSPAA